MALALSEECRLIFFETLKTFPYVLPSQTNILLDYLNTGEVKSKPTLRKAIDTTLALIPAYVAMSGHTSTQWLNRNLAAELTVLGCHSARVMNKVDYIFSIYTNLVDEIDTKASTFVDYSILSLKNLCDANLYDDISLNFPLFLMMYACRLRYKVNDKIKNDMQTKWISNRRELNKARQLSPHFLDVLIMHRMNYFRDDNEYYELIKNDQKHSNEVNQLLSISNNVTDHMKVLIKGKKPLKPNRQSDVVNLLKYAIYSIKNLRYDNEQVLFMRLSWIYSCLQRTENLSPNIVKDIKHTVQFSEDYCTVNQLATKQLMGKVISSLAS